MINYRHPISYVIPASEPESRVGCISGVNRFRVKPGMTIKD